MGWRVLYWSFSTTTCFASLWAMLTTTGARRLMVISVSYTHLTLPTN